MPLSKSSPLIEIESNPDEAIGTLLTEIHPSVIVSLLGTLKAFVVTPSSSGLIGVVIVQLVTPALANGANIINITRAVASLRRLAGIASTYMVRLYTTRSLFYEQVKNVVNYSGRYSNTTEVKKCSYWSHWGELNPRPSPYQGDAIPLSHSGSKTPTRSSDLITTGWEMSLYPCLCCKEMLRQTKVKVVSRRI